MMGKWRAQMNAQVVRQKLGMARDFAKGERLLPRLVGEADRAMMALQEAAAKRAPIAEGTLRGSAQSWAKGSGNSLEMGVEFGGMATAYAAVQHEATSFRHTLPAGISRTHTKAGKVRKRPIKGYRGGQAHFLYGQDPQGAWEQGREKLLRTFDQKVAQIAEEVLSGG